jgi:hypothetical protein
MDEEKAGLLLKHVAVDTNDLNAVVTQRLNRVQKFA